MRVLPMERLFLLNRHYTDVELGLNRPVSCRATTLRRDRTRPTPIHIKAGSHVNVCELLGVSKDEARRVVESSSDYISLRISQRLSLIDPDESFERWTLGDYEKVPAVMREEPYEIRRSTRGKHLPPELDEFGEPIPKETATVESVRRPVHSSAPTGGEAPPDGGVLDEAKEPAAAGALDPGVREAIADSTPSTKWDRERLVAFAVARGIIVPDGMSKNAILRKLRGL